MSRGMGEGTDALGGNGRQGGPHGLLREVVQNLHGEQHVDGTVRRELGQVGVVKRALWCVVGTGLRNHLLRPVHPDAAGDARLCRLVANHPPVAAAKVGKRVRLRKVRLQPLQNISDRRAMSTGHPFVPPVFCPLGEQVCCADHGDVCRVSCVACRVSGVVVLCLCVVGGW